MNNMNDIDSCSEEEINKLINNIPERKYKISVIRGYADLLFQRGQIQVPLINQIQAFLDDFNRWSKLSEEFKR